MKVTPPDAYSDETLFGGVIVIVAENDSYAYGNATVLQLHFVRKGIAIKPESTSSDLHDATELDKIFTQGHNGKHCNREEISTTIRPYSEEIPTTIRPYRTFQKEK
ncbi:hypothetical protein Tco_1516854 [Tanacetum coccineum]